MTARDLAFKVMKFIPSGGGIGLGRLGALGLAGLEYATTVKVWNLLRCELDRLLRVAHPKAFPYIAIIDVANTCNLRCPYCPTGRRQKSGRDKIFIEPDLVRQLLDDVGKYLVSVNLFNWGEPLLHPRIVEIVELIHSRGIWTALSTNLSINNKKVLEDLCDAGLDFMFVSVSGASQATYEEYHRSGKLDLVLENIRHIIQYRRDNNSKNPIVELKYLVFKHNEREIEAAKKMAQDVGVDLFRCVHAGGPEWAESELGRGQALLGRLFGAERCKQLWQAVVLNSDGGLAPCCYLYFKEDDFAEYNRNDIAEIRQNEKFVLARKLFDASAIRDLPTDLRHPCLKCTLVHDQPHLREYLKENPEAVRGHRTGDA